MSTQLLQQLDSVAHRRKLVRPFKSAGKVAADASEGAASTPLGRARQVNESRAQTSRWERLQSRRAVAPPLKEDERSEDASGAGGGSEAAAEGSGDEQGQTERFFRVVDLEPPGAAQQRRRAGSCGKETQKGAAVASSASSAASAASSAAQKGVAGGRDMLDGAKVFASAISSQVGWNEAAFNPALATFNRC